MIKIGILNGPNLNRLGVREPGVYGSATLADIEKDAVSLGAELSLEVSTYQSNIEGELINQIHTWADAGVQGIVFNPGAYTHTSVALRDAIASVDMKVIEVHISNVHAREEFRHTSMTAPVSVGVIAGLGTAGYSYAVQHLAEILS